jgi:hypothetical protein
MDAAGQKSEARHALFAAFFHSWDIKKMRVGLRRTIFCLLCPIMANATPFTLKDVQDFVEAFKSGDDLSAQYSVLRSRLVKTNPELDIRFVLGESAPNFIAIDSELWEKTSQWDNFSQAEAFGRMLCPKHPRNPGKKFLIVIRADDPGDSLVHEYLHFLQQKKEKDLCALYERLERKPLPEDLRRNAALEYEVQRFLLENRAALKIQEMAEANLMEKVARYTKNAPQECQSVDQAYGWKGLDLAALQMRLLEITQNIGNPKVLLQAYVPSDPTLRQDFSEKPGTVQKGIALLSPDAKAPERTLCVFSKDSSYREVIQKAVEIWNAGAAAIESGKKLFEPECQKNPVIEIEVDSKSGNGMDGIIKLGASYDSATPGRKVILLRAKEIRSQRNLLNAVVTAQIRKTPEKKKELLNYLQLKLQQLELNLFAHELGHALGLAHNFNEKEHSIMNYSSDIKLSDYDVDALRLLILGPQSVKGNWNPKIQYH